MSVLILAVLAYPFFWLLLHVLEVSIRAWRLNREKQQKDVENDD